MFFSVHYPSLTAGNTETLFLLSTKQTGVQTKRNELQRLLREAIGNTQRAKINLSAECRQAKTQGTLIQEQSTSGSYGTKTIREFRPSGASCMLLKHFTTSSCTAADGRQHTFIGQN